MLLFPTHPIICSWNGAKDIVEAGWDSNDSVDRYWVKSYASCLYPYSKRTPRYYVKKKNVYNLINTSKKLEKLANGLWSSFTENPHQSYCKEKSSWTWGYPISIPEDYASGYINLSCTTLFWSMLFTFTVVVILGCHDKIW